VYLGLGLLPWVLSFPSTIGESKKEDWERGTVDEETNQINYCTLICDIN